MTNSIEQDPLFRGGLGRRSDIELLSEIIDNLKILEDRNKLRLNLLQQFFVLLRVQPSARQWLLTLDQKFLDPEYKKINYSHCSDETIIDAILDLRILQLRFGVSDKPEPQVSLDFFKNSLRTYHEAEVEQPKKQNLYQFIRTLLKTQLDYAQKHDYSCIGNLGLDEYPGKCQWDIVGTSKKPDMSELHELH